MLNFKNITKSYTSGELRNIVLDDISIDIDIGKISLIIGKSGVGKSTLLNIIGCIIKPDLGYLDMDNSSTDLCKNNMEILELITFHTYSKILTCYLNLLYMKIKSQ